MGIFEKALPGSMPSVFGALSGANIVMSFITTLLEHQKRRVIFMIFSRLVKEPNEYEQSIFVSVCLN